MSGSSTTLTSAFDRTQMSAARRKLLGWYDRNARVLPWRETIDPYSIWISEIMLQQTQVATVIDYYRRFIQRFESVQALAQASEDEVLKEWSGLGYYRRARQLHAAAKVICDVHGGKFPRKFDDVLALPGIGRYTAGAITSFAYDDPQPILEANTIRLFARLIGLRDQTADSQAQKRLWEVSESWVTSKRGRGVSSPGKVNQALMELGSLICKPKNPDCGRCPLKRSCSAFDWGLQNEIPQPGKKLEFQNENHQLVVVEDCGRFLMHRNPPGHWWAGLWDFPRVRTRATTSQLNSPKPGVLAGLQDELANALDLTCVIQEPLLTLKHGVTKYRITLYCFRARLEDPAKCCDKENWKWVPLAEGASVVPLTSTASKLLVWLQEQHS